MSAEPSTQTALLTDSISSITRSAVRFFSGTVLSRISGMLRDMVLAFCFGTHEALAALFVAFRLSHIARRLFGEGALQSSFIPLFEEMRKEDQGKAFRFFRDLSLLLTLFLIGFISLGMVALASSLHIIDWSVGNTQIVQLTMVLLPSLLFICLFGLNASLLQCQKRYFTVGIAPAFFNFAVALGGLFYHNWDANAAMPYVAVSLVIGCMMQWGITFLPTYKAVKGHIDTRLWQGVHLFSQDIRRLLKPLGLGLLGVGASQINNAIDALFARWADPEGPAQLWYAMRLLQLPLALFGIAISGAILPPLSRSIQAGRKDEYLPFLDFAQRRVFALLFPCTMGLIIFGTPLINVLFGHGDFQLRSIITTCGCLHTYAIGLVPMGLIIVLGPAFYAFKDFKTPAKGALLSLSVNLVLDVVFIFGFGMQSISVALATSISSWINIIYLYSRLTKHYEQAVSKSGAIEATKVVIITLAASSLIFLFESFFFSTPQIFHCFKEMQQARPTGIYDQLVSLALPGTLFLLLLVAMSWIFRSRDLLVLFRIRRHIEK